MDRNSVPSPVELDESGWRGRVLGVIKISAKAGFAATLLLAGVVGLIVYGISTAGHHRLAAANEIATVTKPPEQKTPWWSIVPDAQASPLRLPELPLPARLPPLGAPSGERVPESRPVSAPQMEALQAAHERAEHQRALVDAAKSAPPIVRISDGGAATTAGAPKNASNVPSVPGASHGLAAGKSPLPQSQVSGQPPGFLAFASASHDRLFSVRQVDPSPYELRAGSVILAVLLTGINASLPGTIIAQVRDDVFDSVTGGQLLVPRGTRIVGIYDSRVVQGQRRVLVAWNRLLYPDGSSLDLQGMAGVDPAGYAGFGANVDEHLNKAFTSALLLSIIGAGAQLSQPQQATSVYAAPSIGQSIAGALGQQIGNTSIQLTQRQLGIPPTLDVPPGYLFDVLVDRDIVLSGPYVSGGLP
jgi:type IV secretory pathway VirB10-like protein